MMEALLYGVPLPGRFRIEIRLAEHPQAKLAVPTAGRLMASFLIVPT